MASRRRAGWVLGACGLVAVTVAAAVVLVSRASTGAAPALPRATPAVRFVAVTRRDIAMTISLDGTLGFGVERPVKGGTGHVTWLPAVGTVVSRGEPLFRVDDRPVPLFYGDTPLFRTLTGVDLVGRDVKVVADNLKALGYPIGRQPAAGTTVGAAIPVRVRPGDGVLTAALVLAIKRWQVRIGLPSTGVLGASDAVVLPRQARVSAITAQPGDDAGGPLVSVTATAKVVTVAVEATEADAVRSAEQVTVTLPDGSAAGARVLDVSRVATQPSGAGGGDSDQPRLTATVAIDNPAAVRTLDSAPVRVQFTAQTHHRVLVVPVGALLALSEGGYAVQTDTGRLVRVTTGLFDKGMVEVSGSDVAEGLRVVTTS